MKRKAVICALVIAVSSVFMSIGLISGCKSKPHIQVIQPQTIVTNTVQAGSFNSERYVWEGFIFSTNQVKEAKK